MGTDVEYQEENKDFVRKEERMDVSKQLTMSTLEPNELTRSGKNLTSDGVSGIYVEQWSTVSKKGYF